jgi:hypothetical protein
MRFSLPHDRDGRPCLPTHHPRSQPRSPNSSAPIPANSKTPKPRTCWPAWPASPPRELPVAAATRWPASWAWRPPRSWPGRGRSPRSPNGPPTRPNRSGPRSVPAAMAPATAASRPRPPSAAHFRVWTPTCWPAPSAPGWPIGTGTPVLPGPAGGGRWPSTARRCAAPAPGHLTRRRPPGAPAGGHGPRQPRGAGPTPGRRRARGGPRVRPTGGPPRPGRGGGHRRRAADPPRRRRVPRHRQAGPLPVGGQGQPAHPAGPLRGHALAQRARGRSHPRPSARPGRAAHPQGGLGARVRVPPTPPRSSRSPARPATCTPTGGRP